MNKNARWNNKSKKIKVVQILYENWYFQYNTNITTNTAPPSKKKKRSPKQVYKILHLLCFSKVWLLFLKLLLEIADAPTNFVQVSKNLLGHKKTDSPAPAALLEGAVPLMATILNHYRPTISMLISSSHITHGLLRQCLSMWASRNPEVPRR